MFTLLLINFPICSARSISLTIFFFLTGFAAEWVGVHYGLLFGAYHYGDNLGYKVDGIPLLIGINWALLTLSTAAISQHYVSNKWLRAAFGAFLMIALDFFIEPAAPLFDFWYWDIGHAPVQNFVAWFGIAFVLHTVYVKSNIIGMFRISAHVFLAQLVFFIYFSFYHGI
ncbi:MAG: carotenoid biosynthesis protein [Saprospiraceae bacterium]|nr:carotenoid biosynthesis protein [Saprospiraceae bacterium]